MPQVQPKIHNYDFCEAVSSTRDFYSTSISYYADLVDANGECWLDVSFHVFLPVVAKQACSF